LPNGLFSVPYTSLVADIYFCTADGSVLQVYIGQMCKITCAADVILLPLLYLVNDLEFGSHTNCVTECDLYIVLCRLSTLCIMVLFSGNGQRPI
jgi:hypothetical protein